VEDASASLTLDDIKKIPDPQFSKPPGTGFIAPHPRAAVYWIKIDLTTDKNIHFAENPVLYLPYREFTSLDYYKPLIDGSYQKFQVGRQHGLLQKDISSPHIAFSSDQAGWQHVPIYFRVDFRDYNEATTMPAFLYSQSAFAKKAQLLAIAAAATYAVFFTMLIYNISFFLAIREKFFTYYIAYLVSSLVVCMGNDGVWSTWILPVENNTATRILDAVTIIGCICCYLEFICELLQVKQKMKWLVWPVRSVYLYGAIATVAILCNVNLAQHPYFSKNIIGGYSLCYSLIIFGFSFYKKIPYVKAVAPASISLIALGGVYSAYLTGIIPYNEYVPWTMSGGFVAEILVLSVMVAVKIRDIIQERENAKLESIIATQNAASHEQLVAEKSKFIAHVGHDMRQPLHLLRLQLALLKTQNLDESLLTTMAAMKSSINSIESMFEDILYMSQLESGSIVPEHEPLFIAELLQSIQREFTPEATSRNIKLTIFCPQDAHIKTDKQLLKRILINLVQNAIRHTEHGGVLIGCRRRNNGYRIDVIDTGTGIDKASLENIFTTEKNTSNTRVADGNFGLGLSIVFTLCQLINSTIEVKSESGKGSRFSIYFSEE